MTPHKWKYEERPELISITSDRYRTYSCIRCGITADGVNGIPVLTSYSYSENLFDCNFCLIKRIHES